MQGEEGREGTDLKFGVCPAGDFDYHVEDFGVVVVEVGDIVEGGNVSHESNP